MAEEVSKQTALVSLPSDDDVTALALESYLLVEGVLHDLWLRRRGRGLLLLWLRRLVAVIFVLRWLGFRCRGGLFWWLRRRLRRFGFVGLIMLFLLGVLLVLLLLLFVVLLCSLD